MRRERVKHDTPLVDPQVDWTPKAREAGSDARDALLLAHLGLVKYLAHRIGGRLAGSTDYDELAGDGLLGLIEAVDRFDPSHGVLFKTYAEQRIRGAILDGIRARDWAPRSLRRAGRKLEEAIAEVERRKGTTADEQEIADELQMSIEELQELTMQARGIRLGSLPQNEDEGVEPVSPNGDPLLAVEQREQRELVAEEIEGLPERERFVLGLYYEKGLTLKEIGAVLDVTESRVCQIHTRAVARLRGRIAERTTAPA